MIAWLVACGVAVAAALLAYPPAHWGTTGRSRGRVALLALLRAAAVLLVAAMLVGAPRAPARPLPPLLVIDASASWRRAAPAPTTVPAQVAMLADSLRQRQDGQGEGAPDVMWIGDSLRPASADTPGPPLTDAASRLRPAVDYANATGRALWLVTDGEVDDPDALTDAPPGSRWLVPPRPPRADLAMASVSLPADARAGDTIVVDAEVVAGGAGAPAGMVQWLVDGVPAASAPVPAVAPWSTARVTNRVPVPRGGGAHRVTAALVVAGDLEPRNDTLDAALSVTDRPAVVLVSTAPDLDVREVLRVLRGTLRLPVEGYLRVAPGRWRVEGSFAPIDEATVARRAREAALLVAHGDTSWSVAVGGLSRSGARALWRPAPPPGPARAGERAAPGEWFAEVPALAGRSAGAAPPLEAALVGLPADSLPPVQLPAAESPTSQRLAPASAVLVARLAKRGEARSLVEVRERDGQREVRIVGSGFAGWALRGGRAGDAFTAVWGGVFDWLAEARGDARAAVPTLPYVREGEPIPWRRGGADSAVTVPLVRELEAGVDAAGTDTVRVPLRFAAGARETLSPPLAPGRWRGALPGGAVLVVVNRSREWVPRPPALAQHVASGRGRSAAPRRLVDAAWPFVLVLLLLSAEWIGRRFAGYR
jgi:hypothetical protein